MERLENFDSWVDEGIFVGYSSKRKAYKCYNLRLGKVVETINVKIDESISSPNRQEDFEEQDEGEINSRRRRRGKQRRRAARWEGIRRRKKPTSTSNPLENTQPTGTEESSSRTNNWG